MQYSLWDTRKFKEGFLSEISYHKQSWSDMDFEEWERAQFDWIVIDQRLNEDPRFNENCLCVYDIAATQLCRLPIYKYRIAPEENVRLPRNAIKNGTLFLESGPLTGYSLNCNLIRNNIEGLYWHVIQLNTLEQLKLPVKIVVDQLW